MPLYTGTDPYMDASRCEAVNLGWLARSVPGFPNTV
jgi:hypothetical protein